MITAPLITANLITASESAAPHIALRARRMQQLRLVLAWFGAGLVALAAGIVLADVIFPEPTGWRVPLILAVLVAAGIAPCRQLKRARSYR